MRTVTVARWVSLVAAFVWGAVAEYKLATAVGADKYTAVLLPLVLDVWGFAAMRVGRTAQIAGALALMFATQMVSHLLTLGHAQGRMVALSIAVSAIPPAVSLACHRLGHEATPVDAPAATFTHATESEQAAAYRMVDEWTREGDTVDAPAETPGYTVHAALETHLAEMATVDASAARRLATVSGVDTPATPAIDTVDAAPSKAEYAARGAELIQAGLSKTAAAERLGISRQWLHKCMTEVAYSG